jgi:hypothetical protein
LLLKQGTVVEPKVAHHEELGQVAFGLAVLVFCVGPGAAEFQGAAFDFVSTQWHKWPMK